MNGDAAIVATAVSIFFAAVAALAGVTAVIYARKTLGEASATTKAQRDTLHATEMLTGRIESSIIDLELIHAETQAMREVEQLARIGHQLGRVVAAMRRVRDTYGTTEKPPWWELSEQQRLLATLLSGLPGYPLEQCRAIADPANARPPENLDGWHQQATQELKTAMTGAATRLAEASASAAKRRAET
jgi:hypothetical protein